MYSTHNKFRQNKSAKLEREHGQTLTDSMELKVKLQSITRDYESAKREIDMLTEQVKFKESELKSKLIWITPEIYEQKALIEKKLAHENEELRRAFSSNQDQQHKQSLMNDMHLKQITEKFEQFKSAQVEKINQMNKQIDQIKLNNAKQIEGKNQEIHQLSETIEQLERLVAKQEESIQLKDEQIHNSTKRIRLHENDGNEKREEEMNELKGKNRKYFEQIQSLTQELN